MILVEKSGHYLTVPEAAERIGITKQRLRELIHLKRFPFFQFDRVYMIHEDDVEALRVRHAENMKAELERLQAKLGEGSDR